MENFIRMNLLLFITVYILIDRINGEGNVEISARAVGRSCYSCIGIQCTRTTLINNTESCGDPADICVTTYIGSGIQFRGCYSALPDDERWKCENNDLNLCHKCASELCNNLGPVASSCLVCSSSDNSDCLQNPTALKAVRCPISTASNSYCFVQYEGSRTIRGCATTPVQQRDCYTNPNKCSFCLPAQIPECNNIEFPANRRTCISCNSDNCNSKTTSTEYCESTNDQCVAINVNGKQIKKCVGGMSQTESSYCNSHSQQCVKCSETNCNRNDPPGDGSSTEGTTVSGGTTASGGTTSATGGTTSNPGGSTAAPGSSTTGNPDKNSANGINNVSTTFFYGFILIILFFKF